MSTKCSLAYGDGFHLYEEILDDDFIYLSLDNVEFEASQNSVMVRIPLPVWECIRQFSNARFDLVDLDSEMLMARVIKEVDERIEEHYTRGNKYAYVSGFLSFGKPDEPRDQQIKKRLEYYLEEQDRQRLMKKKLDQLMAEN
ncbi:hypothetical protein [Endozoicomonas euniceicola]|uniref:Uncharacterized protein n=1 Tax=Endozoicomonas euniceicola TaxID=1234143 RepID=A0ABY6GWF4_9GAMM|nr:hypothetical protein [Endozoicomonas euniceicola]UYM16309.1 hypothetical protein NX720_26535 [Endozoicomonas euniceicola]